jgi:ABC-type multidrug transport system ATPase subunit/pSer/pThr/pTyr-binding forkhead associated (FHA) protein
MSSQDGTQAPAKPGVRPRLVRLSGPAAGTDFPLTKDRITIGRSRDTCDLVLEDDEISRAHAELIHAADGTWRLEDHSANGSFIDGTRITQATLTPGATLTFGTGRQGAFRFELGAEALAPVVVKTVRIGGDNSPALPTRLQLVLDSHTVRDIPLTRGTLFLGSYPGPRGVTVDSLLINEKHASLEVADDGSTTLRDLGAEGGTYINGTKVTQKLLQEGDLIQLGECETHLLLFRETGARRRTLGEFDLKKPVVTVGRAADNDITLAHPTVSSHHAEIRTLPGNRLELVDLHSANGTFVNGAKIQRVILQAQDRIALGAMELAFDGLQLEREADGKRITVYADSLSKHIKDADGQPVLLLDDISIVLQPCEFIGLLGPSGAGKSTLMDAMNGFRPVDGQVRMNDRSLYQYPKLLREMIGYLPQDDILHTQLTVRQCLAFSARLRMASDHTQAEIDERVESVLDTMRLTERADKEIRSLSGGQRKRASLGIEMLSDPAVLYVDEPTAGQDPATEMQMMQLFRNLANRGSTVVINTHLLGSFSLLDKVAVLARGKLVYFGPATEMLTWFGCKRPTEVYYKLAPPGVPREEEERIAEEWKQRYLASAACTDYVTRPLKNSKRTDANPAAASAPKTAPEQAVDKEKTQHTSWFTQVKTLVARQVALRIATAWTAVSLILPPALIGVLVCLMADQPNEPMTLLILILVAMWFGCSGNVREIVDEWPIYRRERQRSLRLDSYLSAKLIFLIGLSAAQSLVFISILTIGGALSHHFVGAWLLMWLMGVQGGLIGLLISAISASSESALYAFPLAMIPELLLAGLLIPVHPIVPTMPVAAVPGLVMQLSATSSGGMTTVLANGLSPLMISRWGLESLRELYVHDAVARPLPAGIDEAALNQMSSQQSSQPGTAASSAALADAGDFDYRLALLSSIYGTMHPDDLQHVLEPLPGHAGVPTGRFAYFQTSNLPPSNGLSRYITIQAIFILLMCAAIWLAVRHRERTA